ncbi:MAG TPA: hypothetical protein VH087_11580 [Thermoanaerobaculia bacterium]|nr:hypothetical protein [Thermoanaerobaculia bacterium]
MIKKFGYAAAVALVAASAMASNFRAADQVYVPAAGHVGSAVKTFISDVSVSNVTTDAVTVSVIFSNASGTQTVFNNLFTLQPNEHREFTDFVGTAQPNGLGLSNALGQMIFNACKAGGSCDVNDTTGCPGGQQSGVCPDFRNITVESRIYSIDNGSNPLTAPTNGQLFSGYPWYSFVTQEQVQNGLNTVFVTGIRQNGAYHTNIGLVNASQFSSTQFRVKLFQGATQIGSDKVTDPVPPLAAVQQPLTGLFPTVNLGNGLNLWIQVSQEGGGPTSDASANGCPTGCPGFFTYGSVLDNTTGDATTLEPEYFKSITDAQLACLFPASGQTVTCKSTPVIHRAVTHH